MQLYKTVLLSTLGRGAARPFSASLKRFLLLWACALGIGLAMMAGMATMPRISTHFMVTATAGVFFIQATIGCLLLGSMHLLRPGGVDAFGRLLTVLPIRPWQHWLALILPGILLGVVGISFIGPTVGVLLHNWGVPWHVIGAVFGIGMLSAGGLVYGVSSHYKKWRWVIAGLAMWLEYSLLQLLFIHDRTGGDTTFIWLGMSCCFLALSLAPLISRNYLINDAALVQNKAIMHSSTFPSTWFMKKLTRSPITRPSLLSAFCLSIVIGFLSLRWRITDPAVLVGVGSLLIAACTSDMRALCRTHRPAEIANTKGTGYFFCAQIACGISAGLIAIAPLVCSLAIAQDGSLTVFGWLSIVVQLLLGACVGLWVGGLVVPRPRDVSGQCISILLATACLLLPQLPFLATLGEKSLAVGKVALAGMLLYAAYRIEYKRNPFSWRHTHA